MKRVLLASVLFALASPALAGTKVYAKAESLPQAIDAANHATEIEARAKKRCVSSYASVSTCRQLPSGEWECYGVRANQKGSCAK
ncbi:hypothetical protein BV378_14285 [Nostoc sp. RF31YmG]|nr:hypothetical protein BV378_14285 [Nostoc sp. RF31YmG]